MRIAVQKQNVPILRFPEFSEEWKEKIIGDVLKVGSGRDYKHLGAGNIPVYGTGGYMTSVDEYLYDGESVCIGRKGTIDKPVYLNEKFWTVDTLFYTHSFKDSVPKFIYAIFQSINWKQHNEASGVPSLSKATIEKIKIKIPKPEEQQKIASFLCSVDKKIEQLDKKKKLLEQYKKGMMQKLFTQQIRFKDDNGNDYDDWEEKKLEDIASFKKGKGIAKSDIEEDGVNKCIHYGELYTKYNKTISSIFSRTNSKKEYSVLSEDNDILMPASDVTPNGLATASALSEAGIILGGDILIIRSENLLNRYFCYYLASNKQDILRLVSGVTVYHIYGSDMATLKLKLPSLQEQTKIANFLSAIDDKINFIAVELSQSQTFKKGLLQQMFI